MLHRHLPLYLQVASIETIRDKGVNRKIMAVLLRTLRIEKVKLDALSQILSIMVRTLQKILRSGL